MNIGRPTAIYSVANGRMVGQLILQIHDGLGAPDEEDGVSVVQAPHLIRGEQLPAAHLEVGGVGARFTLGLAVGLGVDGGLAQGLRDILVGAGLIAAQV